MLTENQIKIIDDLKTEFTKINKPLPTSSGGIINRAAIDKKFEDTKIRKAEIEAINASTKRAIRELIDRDLDKLNKDLIPMGMCATAKGDNTHSQQVHFGILNGYSSFYIDYYSSSDYEKLADGSGMNIHKSFWFIKYYNDWGSDTYKTIEDLCKDSLFIKRIEDIYLEILKNK